MDITPQNVQGLAEQKDEENFRFRRFLKASPLSVAQLDKLVVQTTDEVWAKVDCTACGNCCKEVGPVLNQADVERLAVRLGMTAQAFIEAYLKPEEDPDEAGPRWEMRIRSCPLLKDNRCSVYEDRPDSCRRYPYLHEPDFVFRMLGMVERTSTCPIVFEVLERLKDSTGFQAAAGEGLGSEEEGELAGESEWPELLGTDETPWEAMRALAGHLPQDHELLESVLERVRELVEFAEYEDANYEVIYLSAVLALAAPALSEEQRRRTAYSLVESLKVAGDKDDDLCLELMGVTLDEFGDAAVVPVLGVIAQLPDGHNAWFYVWALLTLTTPQTEAAVRETVIRVCMAALHRAERGELELLDVMSAGETLARLRVPEARAIIEEFAKDSGDFREDAELYEGKELDDPANPVEQWVETYRCILKNWFEREKDEPGDEAAGEREGMLTNAVAPDRRDNAPRPIKPTLPIVNDGPKVGRNDPCPCGSGKKYKKCCGR